ncbi:helix-turn-helix domain-containing protein [Devosia sp. LjRoot3]|uniref:helix-turn-helix domain-containing protein n=1 Tax=Devosia sp. LjRoot3 TaxID=3342319 RepID=UPI003ECD4D8D
MPKPSELCTALRNWRIRARLQQDAVAKSLGVTQSQVSRWESGRDAPRPHNIEAIRRLICGPEADPLVALRYFVEESHQNLLLMDASHTIIACSRPLKLSSGPLDRFGWVIDPQKNPAFAPVHARFCELLARPAGVVSLKITIPFVENGRDWCAIITKTIHTVVGTRLCLVEPSFREATGLEGKEIRLEEVRLTPDEGERHSLTLWRQMAPAS